MSDPMRRLAGAVTISLLAITLAACGGSTPSGAATASPAGAATPPPASEAPSAPAEASPSAAAEATPGASLATTGRIEVADKGFAVTLPDGWTRVDVTAESLAAAMEASELDPALAEQYAAQVQGLLGAGLAVFAFGPDPTKGTQVTVLALPNMGMSLDLLEQVNKAQLESLAQGDIQTERITLPAGEAIHYRYDLGVEGAPSATLDQYFILAGDNQLVVTATNASEAEAQAIANSIESLD
jgi:hypothetical protein